MIGAKKSKNPIIAVKSSSEEFPVSKMKFIIFSKDHVPYIHNIE